MELVLKTRNPVEDSTLSALHARAFGNPESAIAPWSTRLKQHALAWICAYDGQTLIGFVYACWDGGTHAFVLDPVVDPDYQHHGIGGALVDALATEALAAGCTWLHADYEPHLVPFYEGRLNFTRTTAGLRRLN